MVSWVGERTDGLKMAGWVVKERVGNQKERKGGGGRTNGRIPEYQGVGFNMPEFKRSGTTLTNQNCLYEQIMLDKRLLPFGADTSVAPAYCLNIHRLKHTGLQFGILVVRVWNSVSCVKERTQPEDDVEYGT
jgi:hypothetical protein